MVAFSQEEATFFIKFNNEKASAVFNTIESIYDVRFSYQDSIMNAKLLSLEKKRRSLTQVLEDIENSSAFKFEKINERYIIIKEEQSVYSGVQILEDVLITSYLTKGIQKNKDANKVHERGVWLKQVLSQIMLINNKELISEGYSGIKLGKEIDRRRKKIIAKLLR